MCDGGIAAVTSALIYRNSKQRFVDAPSEDRGAKNIMPPDAFAYCLKETEGKCFSSVNVSWEGNLPTTNCRRDMSKSRQDEKSEKGEMR